MSFQNLLFKHYNRSIQLLLMHCLVLHSQSAALSNVLAGWAIIGSTDTNRRGTDPVKPGTTRSVTGLHTPKEPGYSKENWFFLTLILRQDYRGISFSWMSRMAVYWAITVRVSRWFGRKYSKTLPIPKLPKNYGHTYWGNTVLHRGRMLTRCVLRDRNFRRGRAMWHKFMPHCINTCMWRTLRNLTLV